MESKYIDNLKQKAYNIAADEYVKNGKSNITTAFNNKELRHLVGGQFNKTIHSKIVINAYNECITDLILNG